MTILEAAALIASPLLIRLPRRRPGLAQRACFLALPDKPFS